MERIDKAGACSLRNSTTDQLADTSCDKWKFFFLTGALTYKGSKHTPESAQE